MRTRRATTCFGLFALGALIALTPVCVWSQAGENGKADTVLLADGTPIHLVLMDDLQGEKLQVKQTVHFKVRQDLSLLPSSLCKQAPRQLDTLTQYQRAVSWENQEGLCCSSTMWTPSQVKRFYCGAERGLVEERVVHSPLYGSLVRSRRKHACGNDAQCLCQPRSTDTGPLDGAMNNTTTVAVATALLAVAVNPNTNEIYVANESSNNVTVITP